MEGYSNPKTIMPSFMVSCCTPSFLLYNAIHAALQCRRTRTSCDAWASQINQYIFLMSDTALYFPLACRTVVAQHHKGMQQSAWSM